MSRDNRDALGSLRAGNSGGPGRSPRLAESECLRATVEACPLAARKEIVATAVTEAKFGDPKAREFDELEDLLIESERILNKSMEVVNEDIDLLRPTRYEVA